MGLGVLGVMTAYLTVLARDLAIPLPRVLAAFVPGAIGAAGLAGALLLAEPFLGGLSDLPRLVVMIALGGTVYSAIVAALARRQLMSDLRAFSKAHA